MALQGNAEMLSKAIKDNECARVEELIANGVDINQVDAEGSRPLQHAAQTGCMRCLKLLLNHGADIQATVTMDAPSAVSIAASNGYMDVLKCLLNNCAHENVINGKKEKQPALNYACCNNKIDAVRYII